jgi:uroporphyrinogen decarboxylase
MGAPFVFRPGPTLAEPIRRADQVDALKEFDVAKELAFVPATLKAVQKELDGEMPVLGFAGAPFTLVCFLMNGQSFMKSSGDVMSMIRSDKALAHRLMDKLTNVTIDYLLMQAEAGAVALQLFESAGYLLNQEEYEELALPYQQRIFAALKGKVPTINFAHGYSHLPHLSQAGADIISLPGSITIKQAREHLGENALVQGNVSNKLLVEGTDDEIRAAVEDCIAQGGRKGHIFNLDHGLLRETPFAKVQHIVQCVKDSVQN